MSRLLLFDLDGTLTDPSVGIFNCIRHAFAQLGHAAPSGAELRRWIGPPLLASFTEALDGDQQAAREGLALYRERFATTGLFENQLIDGIDQLLRTLTGRGDRCVVATAKPTVYSTRIISHFGLDPWLPAVYGSELDGTRTDKSELIEYIMHSEGADPARTTMIGDRKHDMVGARANGVGAIGVLWGFGDRNELAHAGAEQIAESVVGLQQLLY